MIKVVDRGIDNLAKLEKLKEKKCRTVNARFAESLKVVINFKVNTEIDQLTLGVSDNLN